MKYFFIIYLYKREEGCPSKMFLFFQGKGTLNLLLVIRGKGGREREREIALDIILITILEFDAYRFSRNARV